jgi:hypothetical protein
MAKHFLGTPHGEKGIYHSYYLPGSAVMFAGSLLVVQGNLVGVCPNSGHYLPTENNTLALLQALAMYGVPLDNLGVFYHNGNFDSMGTEFMKSKGAWRILGSNYGNSYEVSQATAWANLQHPYVQQWMRKRVDMWIRRAALPPPLPGAMPPPVQNVPQSQSVRTAPRPSGGGDDHYQNVQEGGSVAVAEEGEEEAPDLDEQVIAYNG